MSNLYATLSTGQVIKITANKDEASEDAFMYCEECECGTPHMTSIGYMGERGQVPMFYEYCTRCGNIRRMKNVF